MRTTKAISTISYNSQEFLNSKLKELIDNHIISDYMYIVHEPEEDELKQHIHLYLEPNRLVDTMDLQFHFKEIDMFNDKPLGCINFRTSKIDDWILYNQHYPPYLLYKGESRVFVYEKENFQYFDEMTFHHNYIHAFKGSDFALMCSRLQTIGDVVKGNMSPAEAFILGHIPIQQASSVNALMYMQGAYEQRTNRGGRSGHE